MRVDTLIPVVTFLALTGTTSAAPIRESTLEKKWCLLGLVGNCGSTTTSSVVTTSSAVKTSTVMSSAVASSSAKAASSSAASSAVSVAKTSTVSSAAAASSSAASWAQCTSFDWSPWSSGWSWGGFSVDYVKAWYLDIYGLNPPPFMTWHQVSALVSVYGTKTSISGAKATSSYSHGCSNPWTSAVKATSTAKVTSTVAATSTSKVVSTSSASASKSSSIVAPTSTSVAASASKAVGVASSASAIVPAASSSSVNIASSVATSSASPSSAASSASASSVNVPAASSSSAASSASASSVNVPAASPSSAAPSASASSVNIAAASPSSAASSAITSLASASSSSASAAPSSTVVDSATSAVAPAASVASSVVASVSSSSAAAATTTSAASINGYVSQGCYQEISGRLLSNVQTSASDMTIESCTAICGNYGYGVAGVEYGNECYCGTIDALSGAAVSGQCNMACAGDATETCGGPNALNVYYDSSTVAATFTLPSGWTTYGVVAEGTNGRALTYTVGSTSNNTIESCANSCAALGYTVSGTEYSSECYCGNGFSNGGGALQDSSAAFMTCSGDLAETCGGPSILSVVTSLTGTIPSI